MVSEVAEVTYELIRVWIHLICEHYLSSRIADDKRRTLNV